MTIKVKGKKYRIGYVHDPVYGETECWIRNGKDQIIADGIARCSEKDHFSRAMGRKVSLTKAINSVFEEKKDRAAFWAAVWKARAEITTKKWTV